MSLLCLATFLFVGCQTAETRVATAAPTANATRSELLHAAKTDFEAALLAFYKDDWTSVLTIADRLVGVSTRLDQQVEPPKTPKQAEHISAFIRSSAALHEAAKTKDSDRTTDALRQISKQLSELMK